MTKMRAKMRVSNVQVSSHEGKTNCETLHFTAVCKNDGYPADGSDENNTFAKWTPQADVKMTVNNPALFGQFAVGQQFYVDFTPA